MTIERGVRLVAGIIILATVAMGTPECPLYVSKYMLFVTGFVGLMQAQSAFTGFCPAAMVLKALGLKAEGAPQPAP